MYLNEFIEKSQPLEGSGFIIVQGPSRADKRQNALDSSYY